MRDRLTEDMLFLAVTRPALWLGVPIEAALPIAFIAILALILSGNPLYAMGPGIAAMAAARLVVRHDIHAFRLMLLWVRTKGRSANRAHWGGSSYSPLPVTGYRRRGFLRD